jgi:hypothetical protein
VAALHLCKKIFTFGTIIVIVQMTITFENDNDVIAYAFENIVSYTKTHQYIFLAQCVCWLATCIVLHDGLVTHIDNLGIRSKVPWETVDISSDITNFHPDRISQLYTLGLNKGIQSDCCNQDSRMSKSRESSTSGDQLHDAVIQNQEAFVVQSERNRKYVAKHNLRISRQLPKNLGSRIKKIKGKPMKSYKEQTNRIPKSKLNQGKASNERHRCAWPDESKGGHNTLDWFWKIQTGKGTAPFPPARKYINKQKD